MYYKIILVALGKPHEFVCTVKSEGGDGSSYEPPEMQWTIEGEFPFDNPNGYEKVNYLHLNIIFCSIID